MIYNNLENLLSDLPKKGRILSLDIGTKRIGTAICDEDQTISSPKFIIHRKSNLVDFEKILEFFKENNSILLIAGLPLNMDGSESEMSKFVRKFLSEFNNYCDNKIKIYLQDERLSSFEASEFNISKKHRFIDDIAASIILKDFLASCQN